MTDKKLKEYISKINTGCCGHIFDKNKYHIGYKRFKCCKVAVCLDCEREQYIGRKIWKPLYKFFTPRLNIEATVTHYGKNVFTVK
nr:MAG TPA: hypothetical protein [Caudoviricetes sp.]